MTLAEMEVKTSNQTQSKPRIPDLKELFIPCPVCNGTTNIDYEGYSICNSCGQRWTLYGQATG